ncbi:hypothetical protein AB1Y20_015512 [Prymnesium parvum]|uniref:Uncharacterized protein n=1 Tax=Prymnesium parvum TaxID=97485 RepID=A0AB34JYP7_PRYPA
MKTHTDGVRDVRSFSDRWQQLVRKLNESQRGQATTIPETDPARVYARHARLRDLLAANGLVYRFDSHLCAAWSKGLVNLTIEEVADVMLGMRYLNEYCDDFNRVCNAIQEDIGKEVDELAVKHGGYYKGIYTDAVRRVYGHGCHTMQAVRRHLSGDWPEWPEQWPWPVPVPEDAALPTSTRIEEMTDASQDDRSKKS